MAACILVVEDDATICDIINRSLSVSDRRLQLVGSGEAALDVVREVQPDLILIDIGLPGMNGYETSAALRELPGLQQVPIIFLSGRSQAEDNGRSFASGGQLYLRKPFSVSEIRTVVDLALASISAHSR